MKKFNNLTSVAIVFLMILSLIPLQSVNAQLPAGVPREETLILDIIHGRTTDPYQMNAWVPGTQVGWGLHQFILDALWYTDHGDGSLICALAAEPPIYNDDYTQLTIKLRKGIYWSDGVEFTADDVVYTVQTIGNNTGFANYALTNAWVKNIYAADKYTVVIELKSPNPYFWTNFLIEVWGCPYYIMPKHIAEKQEDPAKYNFYPPVSLSAYVLEDLDPNGYWFLLKLRDDWKRTAVGVWCEKRGLTPGPKYILAVAHETDEDKILAQSRHELDWIFDVTTEGWETLRSMNPASRSWFEGYPWIFPYDCTARGIFFQCDKYPYNITDVRWALALAINATEVMITAFDGCQIFVPVPAGMAYPVFKKWQLGLKDELMEFTITLPDGSEFKPFDPTIPYKIKEYAESKGYEITMDVNEIWGPGWWKYAPEIAEQLLEAHGFTKGADGKWRLPDGSVWTITIAAPTFEIDSVRMSMAVAECLRKFGIDATVQTMEGTPFWNNYNYGFFEVGGYWGWGAMDPKLVGRVYESLHSRYYKPEGEYSPNGVRYTSPELDSLIDQVMAISPFDPKAEELTKEILMHLIRNMPAIFMFDCKKFSPYDTTYWVGFPNAENPYWSFLYWCAGAKYIVPRLKPAKEAVAVEYVNVWFTGPVSKFTGVDGKSYGPFEEGQSASIPKDDAERLIAQGLASYRMPELSEIETALNQLLTSMSEVKSSVEELQASLEGLENLAGISGQINTLTMVAAIEGIAIVLLAIALIIRRR